MVRFHSSNLPLFTRKGGVFSVLEHLRSLGEGRYGDWDVWYLSPDREAMIKGRLCAIRKSKQAIELSKKKVMKKASKQGRKLKSETIRIIREPVKIKKYLNTNQFRLYDLIWKRMVASQMAAALFNNTTVDIKAANHTGYLLRTAASVNTFAGFMTLYSEGKDEAEEKVRASLPALKKDDPLELKGIFPEQRFTQPPPRYTEATLVKTLEQNGIGRPSTYAPIISTIQDREYVTKIGGGFQATELGIAVNDLLIQYFPDIINIKFTADMENKLDSIANKELDWPDVIQDFYTPFDKDLQEAVATAEKVKLEDEKTGEACPKCGRPLVFKTGRFGKFVACSGYPECKYTQSYQVKTGVNCPKCGQEIVQRLSKKKKIFYGCSGYPACDFASYLKPVPQPCPQCGGLLTQRGKQAICSSCDYRGKLPQE